MRVRSRTRLVTAVASILVVALVVPALAAPFPGGDVRFSGKAAKKNDLNAAVAYNPIADQYLVVWQDARKQGTRGYEIYGQRVGSDGLPIGSNFRISDEAALAGEYKPDVAFSVTSNRYLVVWGDGRDDLAKGKEIFGQRIKGGGSLAGANFRISSAGAIGDEGAAAVAWNSVSDQFLVVWEQNYWSGTSGWDIYAQRVKPSGKLQGVNFRISGPLGIPALDDEFSPDVSHSAASNKYLVVWSDHRNYSTSGSDIYGARVKQSGLVVTTDIAISSAAADDDDSHPAVAWNSNSNQWLVVWSDARNYVEAYGDIYARRVKGGGTPAGYDIRVVDGRAIGSDNDAAVAFSPDADRYLVVWKDGRDAWTAGNNIYAQWVKPGGATPGDNVLVSGVPKDAQESKPDVAFGSGQMLHLIVWADSRDSATRGGDIYGRLAAD